LNLYRFSAGHGGLQLRSVPRLDARRVSRRRTRTTTCKAIALQGHSGVLSDCTACHASMPNTVTGGPHGMHPISANWADDHADVVEQGGVLQCRVCHGSDLRGTVLSRALGNRSFNNHFGLKTFLEGLSNRLLRVPQRSDQQQRHHQSRAGRHERRGDDSGRSGRRYRAPATDQDANPTTLRIVSQPVNGTVSLAGTRGDVLPVRGFRRRGFLHVLRQRRIASVDARCGVIDGHRQLGQLRRGESGTLGVPALTLGAVPRSGR
jgi:hypothetical protein